MGNLLTLNCIKSLLNFLTRIVEISINSYFGQYVVYMSTFKIIRPFISYPSKLKNQFQPYFLAGFGLNSLISLNVNLDNIELIKF